MGDYDRRQSGGGGYRGKKRRYQQGEQMRDAVPVHLLVARFQALRLASN